MLTDYHVHLRPDEEDTTAARYFTAANAERYRETAAERGIEELGVAEHVHRFSQALDVWEHPWYQHWAVDDLDEYVRFVREDTDLRLGIEADFLPGREDRLANLLDGRPWDYVVGSLHFLRDEAVDVHGAEGWEAWDIWRSRDPERVWRSYFETLGELARCGLFDIMAHPDLVKVWGGRCRGPTVIRGASTSSPWTGSPNRTWPSRCPRPGWRKPVGEIYPDRAFLEMCLDAGRPVALSSDAHVPDHLGYEYERAVEWLADAGVTELAVFEQRERRMEAIG